MGITGFEISFYRDIERIRKALEVIAKSQERIANAAEESAKVNVRVAEATEATATVVTKHNFVPKTPRERGGM